MVCNQKLRCSISTQLRKLSVQLCNFPLRTHYYFLHTRGCCNGLFKDLYWLIFLNIFDLFFNILDQCVCQLVVLVTLDQIWIQMIFRYLTVHTILPPHHTTIDTQHCTSFLLIASKALSMAGWRLLWIGLWSFQSENMFWKYSNLTKLT